MIPKKYFVYISFFSTINNIFLGYIYQIKEISYNEQVGNKMLILHCLKKLFVDEVFMMRNWFMIVGLTNAIGAKWH